MIGAIAGWIAGAIVNFDSESVFLDILIGIIGGYLGYRIFGQWIHITENVWVNRTLTATVGAIILALLLKLIRSSKNFGAIKSRYSRHRQE